STSPSAPTPGAEGLVPSAGYTPVAKALHWTTAILVLGMLGVGLWMTGLPISLLKLQVYGWHKWIGLSVLALTLLRLAWRWQAPPPELPGTVTPWERRAARTSHWFLLALLLAQPIDGWLMSSAGGVTVYWFGLLRLPDLVARDQHLFAALRTVHEAMAYALMAMIALHLLAVVHHDILRRDGIFSRMWR
ncbi:MAG: cytochrome b, partial [Reyranellales bacterium]